MHTLALIKIMTVAHSQDKQNNWNDLHRITLLLFNSLKGRGVNWLHFAIQV